MKPLNEKKILIDIIAGARPNFVKIASIIKAIERNQSLRSKINYRLIHTGQHYDDRMSRDFFMQLDIPDPKINFNIGSGTPAGQTGAIMRAYENLLQSAPSSVCIVVGDVTSTLACAIVAKKLGLTVAHVEAGIRSRDWTMPEEINRVVTDSVTDWFFTTSEYANENLTNEGVSPEKIFFVGNTMIDTLFENMSRLIPPDFYYENLLDKKKYAVLTLHRPSNVDNPEKLSTLISVICDSMTDTPIVFPVHPRTSVTLKAISSLPRNILVVSPQPYLEFNFLVKNSLCVITDSGGITEEATVLSVPCVTLRDSTERPETVEIGTNELAGTDKDGIAALLLKIKSHKWKRGGIPPLWDGSAGDRIAAIIESLV